MQTVVWQLWGDFCSGLDGQAIVHIFSAIEERAMSVQVMGRERWGSHFVGHPACREREALERVATKIFEGFWEALFKEVNKEFIETAEEDLVKKLKNFQLWMYMYVE